MTYLILGLIVFLGVHSLRVVADPWRTAHIARVGEKSWKGLYALASLLGFALIIWGYGRARLGPVLLWNPPLWTHYVAAVLTLVAFVLITAGNIPGTRIKAWLGHPMVLGVKIWAFAHLISNGTLAATILFGGFLVWAIVVYASSRRRDRATGIVYPAGTLARDAVVVTIGIATWAVFAFVLHGWLIGVRPLG